MDLSEVKNLPKVDHSPAELDDASKLLLKAADLIEKHGLAKQRQVDELTGAMCAYGAMMKANGGIPGTFHEGPIGIMREANRRLTLAIYGEEVGGPADWNNEPKRTKDEVVAKLRAVALGG